MIHGAGLLLIEGPLQNLDGVAMCGHESSSAWTAYTCAPSYRPLMRTASQARVLHLKAGKHCLRRRRAGHQGHGGAEMKPHTLSISLATERFLVGATSPRGDLVPLWNIESGALLGSVAVTDAKGIHLQADGRAFAITTRKGEVHYIDTETLTETSEPHGLEVEQATGWGSRLNSSLA